MLDPLIKMFSLLQSLSFSSRPHRGAAEGLWGSGFNVQISGRVSDGGSSSAQPVIYGSCPDTWH